MNTSHF
nr:unnamed protein product [Saccharomyces cerevisiae]